MLFCGSYWSSAELYGRLCYWISTDFYLITVSSQEDCVIDGKAVKTLICTVWQHECAP